MYREQLLFLCSRNQWRSPTAAVLFKDNDLYVARSAGTSDSARIKITAGLINWADRIFVMEKRHLAIIHRKYGEQSASFGSLGLRIASANALLSSALSFNTL